MSCKFPLEFVLMCLLGGTGAPAASAGSDPDARTIDNRVFPTITVEILASFTVPAAGS